MRTAEATSIMAADVAEEAIGALDYRVGIKYGFDGEATCSRVDYDGVVSLLLLLHEKL
jgi:hypothetical protein